MIHKRLRSLAVLHALLLLLLLCNTQAHAQYSDSAGGSFNNPISSGLSSSIWGNLQMQQNLQMQRLLMESSRRRSARNAAANRDMGRAATTNLPATTTFAFSASRTTVRQLAAGLGQNPTQRQQFEVLFAQLLKAYREDEAAIRTPATRREPGHDIARSVAYFILGNYYVYSDGVKPTPEQYEGLCGTVRAYLQQNEQFRTMGDARKQQIYEALAIMAMLPQVAYEQAMQGKDLATKATARQLAAQNLAQMGIDAARLQLTDEGVTIR